MHRRGGSLGQGGGRLRRATALAALLAFCGPAASAAATTDAATDQWLPRADGAEWVYEWTDSHYSPAPRRERYTVASRAGSQFRLRWQDVDPRPDDPPNAGMIDFRHTDAGLINLNYQSTPPPPQFPILCASASECGNSLAATHFLVIWGTRSPTLAEPLLRGTRWNSVGGADNDVASASRYIGRQRVVVPAFPQGVLAARVDSDITQAGAIGDPYGSGVRTVFWVRGVGPVKVVFRHAGGEVTQSSLVRTNLTPKPMPSDRNLLPLNRGSRAEFRWRNDRHMRRWSRQRFDVVEVVNNTARVDVRHLSGPIRVAGSYTFATRLSGVTHLAGFTRAATRVRFPELGPRDVPRDRRRRFLTPYDLMVFGFGPVVPVHVEHGEVWRSSRDGSDWRNFRVTGRSKILGTRRVRTPAGRFRATVVESLLTQRGVRFGSGTRRAYFAEGRGLVKLTFRHADGSVSTVERLR